MYKLYKNRKKYHFKDSFDFLSFPIKINNINVLIVNDKFIKVLLKDNISKDFNKLVSKVILFLDEDQDDETAVLLLSELANLQNIIFNLYSEFFTKKELDLYLRNIRLLANELKNLQRIKKNTVVNTASQGQRRR